MRNFIKDALIIICIMIFLTSLFKGVNSSNKSSINVDSSIREFEENISNEVIILDPVLEESPTIIEESDNVFGKIGYFLSKVVISIVNGIIKIILFLIQKIV